LAGYEDVNDAERLCRDPAMRWVVDDRAIAGFAASASQMGRFETKWLCWSGNLAALADLPSQCVGFIVTNLARSAEGIVAFYNQRRTAEQHIKQGKGAIKWTRLSCRTFAANAVRLQLHALAYNLGNFIRTLAMRKPRSRFR